MGSWRRFGLVPVLVAAAAVASACAPLDAWVLSSDRFDGRDNHSTGSVLAREHLLDELASVAVGADRTREGDGSFLQVFPSGTNVVAVVPGTDLAHEYVLVGAHYDHLGQACRTDDPADTVCNGAVDNATGVGVALDVARSLAAEPARRSVVIALWDAEEDDLAGSRWFVEHPLVPLDDVVASVNVDMLGADLTPALSRSTFAVAAESGGAALVGAVAGADRTVGELDVVQLSAVFGMYRSDYAPFLTAGVPTVSFSDSTGPCYHSAQDEFEVVDVPKLIRQDVLVERVVRSLADGPRATFTPAPALATYDDAVALSVLVDRAWADLESRPVDQRMRVADAGSDLRRIVARGADAFDAGDVGTVLGAALTLSDVAEAGPCLPFGDGH